ncbi:ABC transporter ATP-binding protein, partial [Burkholderia multivorans]
DLAEIGGRRVRDVLAEAKTTFTIEGRDFTPAQLLERLGFAREHLSARVNDLSGGQKRRLQLLLLLMSEPNVIILDEPNNSMGCSFRTPRFYRRG